MTANEAIKILEVAKAEYEWNAPLDYQEAFDLAISALQAQEAKHSSESSLTQKALDTISRRVAIDTLDKHLRMTDVPVSYPGIISALTEWLNELPSAQTEIITCGDCRYKDDGIDEDGIPFLKYLHGRSYGGTRINDFCSWAERRTDD